MRLDNGFAAAQRAYDAMLPPEDPWEWEHNLADESTLEELHSYQINASCWDDTLAYNFWTARISERPDPDEIGLYLRPDGENLIVIYDKKGYQPGNRNLAEWPTYLEALCPGYCPVTAVRIAVQAHCDLQHYLLEEYVP